jgi:hypothetical protein
MGRSHGGLRTSLQHLGEESPPPLQGVLKQRWAAVTDAAAELYGQAAWTHAVGKALCDHRLWDAYIDRVCGLPPAAGGEGLWSFYTDALRRSWGCRMATVVVTVGELAESVFPIVAWAERLLAAMDLAHGELTAAVAHDAKQRRKAGGALPATKGRAGRPGDPGAAAVSAGDGRGGLARVMAISGGSGGGGGPGASVMGAPPATPSIGGPSSGGGRPGQRAPPP